MEESREAEESGAKLCLRKTLICSPFPQPLRYPPLMKFLYPISEAPSHPKIEMGRLDYLSIDGIAPYFFESRATVA
jgi:hypothetical protein